MATKRFNLLEPENTGQRRPTFNAQCFVDVRVLASLHVGLKALGFNYPNKTSELLRSSIELLHDVLVKQGRVTPIESTAEAVSLLEREGFSMDQLRDRRKSAKLERALVAEAIAKDFSGCPPSPEDQDSDQIVLPEDVDPEWWEDNLARFKTGEEMRTYEAFLQDRLKGDPNA